jgi:hypothetical protein
VFFSVTVLAALVVPASREPKSRIPGVTVATGDVPTPVSATDWDPPRLPESSPTVSDPMAGPAAVGEKETFTTQDDPAGNWPGQALVSVNGPVVETPERFSGLPPKLEIVTGWEGLTVPVFWEKARVGGDRLTAEGLGVGSGMGVTPKT